MKLEGWRFEHTATGHKVIVINDGVNNMYAFRKDNPQYVLRDTLYAGESGQELPPLAGQAEKQGHVRKDEESDYAFLHRALTTSKPVMPEQLLANLKKHLSALDNYYSVLEAESVFKTNHSLRNILSQLHQDLREDRIALEKLK